MYAALLLLGVLVWLCIAGVAGWIAYRQTRKRWVQLATALFVIWLPFWDVIPGLYFYYKAIREVGGVRVHRTAMVEGYLDLTATDCYSCWNWLDQSPYRYLEVYRSGSTGALFQIEKGAGYYEYLLLPSGDERCKEFESLPTAERIMSRRGLQGQCVAYSFRQNPRSRYELYSSEESPFPRVVIATRQVRDRVTGERLAESTQVYFPTWLGSQIEIPFWRFTRTQDGERIEFQIDDVLIPM